MIFVPGIGSYLKVSYTDPRVCFGNELTNLSVRKSFLPRYIKSPRPSPPLPLVWKKTKLFSGFFSRQPSLTWRRWEIWRGETHCRLSSKWNETHWIRWVPSSPVHWLIIFTLFWFESFGQSCSATAKMTSLNAHNASQTQGSNSVFHDKNITLGDPIRWTQHWHWYIKQYYQCVTHD